MKRGVIAPLDTEIKTSYAGPMIINAHRRLASLQDTVDINEWLNHLKRGKLAFLVGAGISKNEPSLLPLWDETVLSIIQALVGKREAEQFTEAHMRKLEHLEVLVQLLREELDEMAYEPLSVALGNKVWNPLHLFLSWAVVYHDAKVLTPNIDVLIETSGKDVFPTWSDICRVPVKPIELRQWLDSRKGGILKLHGTIEHVHTVRIAINDIFVGLGHPLKRCFSEVLKSHHLLVLGYRGADEFDINPVLFRSRPKARILWVFHCESPGSDPEATERLFKRHEHLLSRLQRLNAEIAIAETQEFVRRLCLLSLQSDKDNMPSELVEWATSSVFPCCQTTPLTSSLWESQLQAWAAKISPEDRLHVWARILEYVGEYQKAMDVYQRCF